MRLFAYGDSWTYGEGLKENEKTYVDIIAEKIQAESFNRGISGNSNPVLIDNLYSDLLENNIRKDDKVFVSLTNTTRYKLWLDGFTDPVFQKSKYSPIFPGYHNVPSSDLRGLYKHSLTQEQAYYETLFTIHYFINMCKLSQVDLYISFAFTENILLPGFKTGYKNSDQQLVDIRRKRNINYTLVPDLMTHIVDQNLTPCGHADAIGHKMFAEYLENFIK